MKLFIKKTVWLVLIVLTFTATNKNLYSKDYIQKSGDILQLALPSIDLGFIIFEKDGVGLLQFSESFALTLGVTYALKYSVNEERPNGGSHSFPSGHTSASFAAAEFLEKRYGWQYGLPAFAVATFVGYSRIESHQHYTHDVIAGAAIGFLSAYLFTKPFKGWQINVDGDTKTIGMRFSKNF